MELFLIILMGTAAALITWRVRTVWASIATVSLMAGYVFAAYFAYVEFRWWLPIIYPVAGAILMEHIFLTTYRAAGFERFSRK
jgi:CHASE2 domain-containing sensor protein